MTRSRVLGRAIVVPAVALALAVAAAAVVWSDFSATERAVAGELLTPARVALVALFAVVVCGIVGMLVWRTLAPQQAALERIVESARLIVHGNPGHRIAAHASDPAREVADAINAIADERSRLAGDIDRAVGEANARIEAERTRLAALVAELDQAVLVCNRDGRVLLYNAAASALLGGRGNDHVVGLGRSIFGLLGRAVVLHAIEELERQLERDERERAHFVTTTPDGRLLRVRAAAVTASGREEKGPTLAGYVLLLADVTAEVDADAKRAALLQQLVEGTRARIANIRAAIETLADHPDMDPARKTRFAAIIHDESVALSERLHGAAAELGQHVVTRWPLEEVVGEDLLTLAQRRIERDARILTKRDAVESQLWLQVDSFSITQALAYLARRLAEEFSVREVRFRLASAGGHAQLDIAWRGPPLSSETAFAWQRDPFSAAGVDSPLTLAEVIGRHGGEAWYQRDVPSQTAYFRLLLPLAKRIGPARSRHAVPSRPEFYDFDLFRRSPASDALDGRRLDELAYTVFDTETTGLQPSEGDEIIAIGAVRIVNGRVLAGETFETLVDPGRPLSDASIAIHGITAAMLSGQPTIDAALPRLYRFAEETVLVGHNAAFDMRFLEMKEAHTGIRFDQPVLDTLLLSAVVHPAQSSHGLDEIAARLGVPIVGRHTALGDALVTADVFLRLLPLLREKGVVTLGDARAAAQRTYYARLAY